MSWNAVPVAVMAGIAGYAAVLFAGLYFALGTATEERARREYLTFALTCLGAAGYEITNVMLYNAQSFEQGLASVRGSLVCAAFVASMYTVFVWDFLKRPVPFAYRCSNAALCVLAAIVSFWNGDHTLTAAHAQVKHVRVFNRVITLYEPEYGPLSLLLMFGFVVTVAALASVVVHYFRRDGRTERGRVAFLAATSILFVTTTNDVLATIGVTQFMYLFEYGLASLLMAIGYVLLMRFSALHSTVDFLNRDLTRSNVELVLALEQARESNRVKTEFLASISHELRTPLNAIINLPEGMIEDLVRTPRARCRACGTAFELDPGERLVSSQPCSECGAAQLQSEDAVSFAGDGKHALLGLQTVVRAGRHLLGLVNNLLDASKLDLGRAVIVPTAFDPMELVEEVVESMRATATKSNVVVRFERERPEQQQDDVAPSTIMADRVRIGQVLYNLIGNAIKFSPDGGTVEVSVGAPSSNEWQLRVRDHGIGIAPEDHALIFEKFRQVDSSSTRTYGGTGLGLAISKALVELHGGRIWVESAKGRGATFCVVLPRTAAEAPGPAQVKPAA
jgi:signal transduction histidine kinase